MPTNQYVNFYTNSPEQTLYEDLIYESIKFWGIDIQYIPRTINDLDELYTEDPTSTYDAAYPLEVFIKSIDGYEGDQIFLSKFNMEIRDQVTFTVAKRAFANEVTTENQQSRPREGDLIWLTLNPDRPQLFQIKYVNDRSVFYQLGYLNVYDLVAESFEYSGEHLNTGIAAVDAIEERYSLNMNSHALTVANGNIITTGNGDSIVINDFSFDEMMDGDSEAINEYVQEQANTKINFTIVDPFTGGNY